MNRRLLEVLRCPFCGSRLSLEAHGAASDSAEIAAGVLSCSCCVYPVVEGIPYLRTGPEAARALQLLDSGAVEEALFALLGLTDATREQFERLWTSDQALTFRNALALLSPEAETPYFFYRFSDPTFLVSDALVHSLGQDARCARGYVLDMCGGTGHLTRSLTALDGPEAVVLADLSFWELWLAKRFVAPACHPVCCDANEALPFARHAFSLVLCSGAFEYVWARRMLAGEMVRLVGEHGVVAVTHTHNSLCENPSQGMPLDPSGYRALFEGVPVRLFKESVVLDSVLARQDVSLSADYSDDELAGERALIIVATHLDNIFRRYTRRAWPRAPQRPAINPLYAADPQDRTVLRLRFPSEYYETEHEECKRYLPPTVTIGEEVLERLARGDASAADDELLRRYVVLELPERYL